jgi:hypothetical protein
VLEKRRTVDAWTAISLPRGALVFFPNFRQDLGSFDRFLSDSSPVLGSISPISDSIGVHEIHLSSSPSNSSRSPSPLDRISILFPLLAFA